MRSRAFSWPTDVGQGRSRSSGDDRRPGALRQSLLICGGTATSRHPRRRPRDTADARGGLIEADDSPRRLGMKGIRRALSVAAVAAVAACSAANPEVEADPVRHALSRGTGDLRAWRSHRGIRVRSDHSGLHDGCRIGHGDGGGPRRSIEDAGRLVRRRRSVRRGDQGLHRGDPDWPEGRQVYCGFLEMPTGTRANARLPCRTTIRRSG